MRNPTTPREMIAYLQRENAELREALLNATTLLRRWNRNEITEDVFVETRKAIDAARKEAQP